jgi:hypothetical protein
MKFCEGIIILQRKFLVPVENTTTTQYYTLGNGCHSSFSSPQIPINEDIDLPQD